ncbi:hypothetical protein P280DRAFT_223337 [Massarina eburnea CBS 473.64]|uniref:Uncharacterized protein n=1 Tax=Massarina eburnea CBS 473.64 TaxID=1395130 RepID=A0A6A6S8L0_9PLEO|nr:hypothetical protein P280DRAFT_223337 [Massarina eburnea CBS 473.64]
MLSATHSVPLTTNIYCIRQLYYRRYHLSLTRWINGTSPPTSLLITGILTLLLPVIFPLPVRGHFTECFLQNH